MSNLKSPKVCIILVNYNGYKDTVECVQSLLECLYDNYEIIIVDNASNDINELKNDVFLNEHCKIVYSSVNGGFSEGNNIGIEASKEYDPKYILLLNNDTIVKKDFLNKMVDVVESNENIGIVTGIINYFYDQDKTWYNFGSYNKLIGYTKMLNDPKLFKQINGAYDVSFSTGCLMLIPYTYIQKYGMLSNDYFLYSEDSEFCLRALENGYKIVSIPEVLIYHKVNGSTGTGSDLQQYYLVRNYLMVAKKYGTCFPLAYMFRWLLSRYEILRYHYNSKVIKKAYQDYKKGIIGKVEKFR